MEHFPKHPKEITYLIGLPLEIYDCGFTLISSGNMSTTVVDHLSTTNVAQQWALLTKQWKFTKVVSHITIIWASRAPSNTSSFEINLNSKQHE
jgi:hypothetical protein